MLSITLLRAEILDPLAGGCVAAAERLDALDWRYSSFCNGGGCVEIAVREASVAVRASGSAGDHVLTFPASAWQNFVTDIKNGDFL